MEALTGFMLVDIKEMELAALEQEMK